MTTLHPPMDDPDDTGQILYSSLLILGLDAASLEHNLRTPVNQKIFVRMNKKLGESILHFLFTCIDGDRSAKVFRDCWPIVDKKQESQFHKITFEWYKTLQQGYGQPIPVAVAKTFLSPGGPKFTAALMTLTTVAMHSSIDKKASEYTLLHFPVLSRNPNQNRSKMRLLQASKKFHLQEFRAKHRTRQNILLKIQEKAKSLIDRYRNLCVEDEKTKQELKAALQKDTRLSPLQKDHFLNVPLSQLQEEITSDISKLNEEAGQLWGRVKKFEEVESSSWKVLAPLLEGTTSLSHLDGSLYSPIVPEIVYKDHASTINKMGLQGLYTDGKLNLLSLMQYSTLALQSLLHAVQNTHSFAKPECTEELRVQAGRAASMSDSMNELSSKLNVLLPGLIDSVSALRLCNAPSVASVDSWDLEGKFQLCPPTPPLSLVNTPVRAHQKGRCVSLLLTPGALASKRRTVHGVTSTTPSGLLSLVNMSRAGRRSPKANVVFSPATHLDDSVIIDASDEANLLEEEAGLTMEMVTVDCRGSYQIKNERKTKALFADTHKQSRERKGLKSAVVKPSRIPKHSGKTHERASALSETLASNQTVVAASEKNVPENVEVCNSKNGDDGDYISKNEENEDSLMDRLADMLAASAEGDDSGALEMMTTFSPSSTTVIEASVGDSGCAEETLDSETLLDAIEKIDITPKDKRKKKCRDSLSLRRTMGSTKSQGITSSSLLSPLSKLNIQTPGKSSGLQEAGLQCARLIDMTPFNYNVGRPFKTSELSLHDPFKTPMPLQPSKGPIGGIISEDLKEEGASSVTSGTEDHRSSNEDLLARMSFLTQSPARDNPTPLASKLLSNFEGIRFGKDKNAAARPPPEGDAKFGATVEELRHRSKVNINNLMEQVNQVKLEFPSKVENMKQRRKTALGCNSKFLSFVENVKSGKDSSNQNTNTRGSSGSQFLSFVKNVKSGNDSSNLNTNTMGNGSSQTVLHNSENKNNPVNNEEAKSKVATSNKNNFQNIVARMESMVGDMDDTLTNNSGAVEKVDASTFAENEFFMNSQDFEKTLLHSPDRRSSYLPKDSVFDTLTESILGGEVSSTLLTNEDVREEVRRESISSRRQSLMSLGRMSICSNKGLSEALSAFQSRMSADCSADIVDESDSLLLSTSTEDFGFF